MKTYSVKSSAVRAAKQAGLVADQYTVHQDSEGQWYYLPVENDAAEPVEVVEEVEEPTQTSPSLFAAMVQQLHDSQTKKYVEPTKAAKAPKEPKEPKPEKVVIEVTHESQIKTPCKRVWEIAEALFKADPKTKRRDVLAECVKQGVAYYTARTQFQAWVTLQKEMKANEQA